MNRPILVCAFFVAAIATLGAQETSQSNPYQGVSNPPSNDTITSINPAPQPKPPAGHHSVQPAAAPAPQAPAPPRTQAHKTPQAVPQSAPARTCDSSAGGTDGEVDGTDSGIVLVSQPANDGLTAQPAAENSTAPPLATRADASNPDGDIVHPAPLGPNELGEGTSIRVRLLTEVSSAMSEKGETFRSQVASDVLQGNHVLIPAGSEIDGTVAEASMGHFGGHGSLLLRPESVVLPDGTTYQIHAAVYETPGSNANVKSEGTITPGSQVKRDSIEYGGAMGAGAVTGAVLGGPTGALAGTLVGFGVITTHLLVSHPQVQLDEGSVLLLTLTQPLNLVQVQAGSEVSKERSVVSKPDINPSSEEQ